jgi:hypothetical protein
MYKLGTHVLCTRAPVLTTHGTHVRVPVYRVRMHVSSWLLEAKLGHGVKRFTC